MPVVDQTEKFVSEGIQSNAEPAFGIRRLSNYQREPLPESFDHGLRPGQTQPNLLADQQSEHASTGDGKSETSKQAEPSAWKRRVLKASERNAVALPSRDMGRTSGVVAGVRYSGFSDNGKTRTFHFVQPPGEEGTHRIGVLVSLFGGPTKLSLQDGPAFCAEIIQVRQEPGYYEATSEDVAKYLVEHSKARGHGSSKKTGQTSAAARSFSATASAT